MHNYTASDSNSGILLKNKGGRVLATWASHQLNLTKSIELQLLLPSMVGRYSTQKRILSRFSMITLKRCCRVPVSKSCLNLETTFNELAQTASNHSCYVCYIPTKHAGISLFQNPGISLFKNAGISLFQKCFRLCCHQCFGGSRF